VDEEGDALYDEELPRRQHRGRGVCLWWYLQA
jgi:hypothetical protein